MKFLALCCLSCWMIGIACAAEPAVQVTLLMTKPLVGFEGREAAMITVEIPPKAESPPHRHNANALVYVLEGSVIMQVKGGEAVSLHAGQTFYESPADVHLVARNLSSTRPAKLLVVLVKAIGEPISVPAS